MNRQHFWAFVWLRWRLRVNQWRRGGALNAAIMVVVAGACVVLGAVMFVAFLMIGLEALSPETPLAFLAVWDGLVIAMLFFWLIGLVTELQRAESLSLDKFLHLPVSMTAAFLINYLSSIVRLTTIVFLPAMIGLSLGLVFSRGPAMLLLLPLVAAFFLMISALSYQFQGWLAVLMANKRRRRTVIVVVTMIFMLLGQLPNLLNLTRLGKGFSEDKVRTIQEEQHAFQSRLLELKKEHSSGAISADQYLERLEQLNREEPARVQAANEAQWQPVARTARFLNLVLLPGWLPMGADNLAQGSVLPALLGTLGLALIGSASFWRAYRTTVRLYTGEFNAGQKKTAAVVAAPRGKPATSQLLEKELPWIPEHAGAVALASFRSLTRAPEVKMLLLTPIILGVIFGAMFLRQSEDPSDGMRIITVFGAMVMVLFSLVQLAGNQFGFDRSGFRVFVLCPAQRRDILLGKNLAVAPFALGLGLVAALVVEVIHPLRFDHFLAALVQLVSMYLLFCILLNWLALMAPMPVSAGSLKPASPKGLVLLLHFAMIILLPLVLTLTLLPLGIELVLNEVVAGARGLPTCLVLSLGEVVVIGLVYHLALTWQGDMLQSREQRILDIVTPKAE